jgi:ribosomal protein S18 acetylase RimI-like enzyme
MTPFAIGVRPARRDDHTAVIELLNALAAEEHTRNPALFLDQFGEFSDDTFDELLGRSNELHLAAEVDGTVSGYLRAWRFQLGAGNPISNLRPRPAVHIQIIVVNSAHRRRGLGRTMFASVEHWAMQCKAEAIGLNVSKDNIESRAFYAALGFGVSTVYLVKDLKTE